jgi:hypothetical protein
MAEFVIDRSVWRAGGGSDNKVGIGLTYLMNNKGFMCCLGQTCKQLGYSNEQLISVSTPENLEKHIPYFTVKDKSGVFVDSKLSSRAVEINDDTKLTREQRERKLKSLFSKFKHKITFVGEYKHDY